jgi:branched-chain amino acid aminotransferase
MGMINYNGQLINEKEPVIAIQNRAFRYGDGFFESMIAVDGTIPFFDEHWPRITRSVDLLKLQKPGHFTPSFLKNKIVALLKTNHLQNARIRVTFMRDDGGLYTPATNQLAYLIETGILNGQPFSWNKAGIHTGIFKDHYKPDSFLSSIKTINAQLFVMAGIFKQENDLDDCFIINEKGNVVEAISSNVFLIKDSNVFTPSLQQGPVAGVMRKVILTLCRENGFSVFESKINIKDLEEADEVFLTNAVQGIQWVRQLGGRTYKNNYTRNIHRILIEEIENRVILEKAKT